MQNLKGSLIDKVKVIQRAGLLVYGGFIIGFDNDPGDIFQRQIDFITAAAIPNAMMDRSLRYRGPTVRPKEGGRTPHQRDGPRA